MPAPEVEAEPVFPGFPVAITYFPVCLAGDRGPGAGKSRDLKVACSSYDLSAIHSTYGQKGSLNNSVSVLYNAAQFNLVTPTVKLLPVLTFLKCFWLRFACAKKQRISCLQFGVCIGGSSFLLTLMRVHLSVLRWSFLPHFATAYFPFGTFFFFFLFIVVHLVLSLSQEEASLERAVAPDC